mmetsp:Transcript_56494/g.148554  ORF Transcript_56494/g.148554 Transcript_56494/m.148554 type:complete len:109 (-) Transcript_56494:51-377(-)
MMYVCGPCHVTDCQIDVVKIKHLDPNSFEISDSTSREVIPVSSSPSRRERPSPRDSRTPARTPRRHRVEATAEQCLGEVSSPDLRSRYAACWRAEAASASKGPNLRSP